MTSPRIGVAVCMRNEGPFILEWVAYFRELGFDEILVMSNDCDDGSDLILDRLDSMGEITHLPNPEIADLPPLARGIVRAFKHPKIVRCDWLLLCDADEFPCIHYGEGKIHDLIKAMPKDTDCIALHWKAFGTNGLKDFPAGENVIEVNTFAQDKPDPAGFHKSIFRPEKFADAIDHMPKTPLYPVVVRNADGTELKAKAFSRPWAKFRGNPDADINFNGACMHHYAIRADDIYVMKNHRGDGRGLTNTKYHLNSSFYNRFNRSDIEDTKIQRHVPALAKRKAAYLDDPILADLTARAIGHFQTLKAKILTPEQLRAWTKIPKP